MTLVQAGTAHAPVLQALHKHGFYMPWQASEFETLLRQPGVVGWIATEKESPLGFILLRAAADEAEILTLVVDPARRRAGIAARLMRTAMETLRAGLARHLFLEVSADNTAALALYESCGFVPCGRRPDYYRGESKLPRVDAIVMRCGL